MDRRDGLPLNGSHIESAIKQINLRVKGTEKFRRRDHADAIYAEKATELRDEETHTSRETEAMTRERYDITGIAVKSFELSQTRKDKWLNADYRAKHQLLEIVCLNFSLDGVTLALTKRKPFDLLAERPAIQWSRGDCPIFEPHLQAVRRFSTAFLDGDHARLRGLGLLATRIAQ